MKLQFKALLLRERNDRHLTDHALYALTGTKQLTHTFFLEQNKIFIWKHKNPCMHTPFRHVARLNLMK